MRRRRLLHTGGLVWAFGLSGCVSERQAGGSLDGRDYNQLQSGNIRSVEWINLDVLRVTFREKHSLDGIGIQHEYDSAEDPNDDLFIRGAPRFGGSRNFPLIDKIRHESVVYPTLSFEVVEYKGRMGGFSFDAESVGTDRFTVPEQIAPPDKFESIQRTPPPTPQA